jgi:hypothetical protein
LKETPGERSLLLQAPLEPWVAKRTLNGESDLAVLSHNISEGRPLDAEPRHRRRASQRSLAILDEIDDYSDLSAGDLHGALPATGRALGSRPQGAHHGYDKDESRPACKGGSGRLRSWMMPHSPCLSGIAASFKTDRVPGLRRSSYQLAVGGHTLHPDKERTAPANCGHEIDHGREGFNRMNGRHRPAHAALVSGVLSSALRHSFLDEPSTSV